MIPKIIHYTWFSNDPYPEEIQQCIDSWHKHMPEYEFRLWNMDNIKDLDSDWVKEAISVKKWAFAADYVRLYAVYNYGGIYLDTDCIVFKSFDPLLNKAFICREHCYRFGNGYAECYLGSHCFGAEKGNPYIKRCLDYYDGRHFIQTTRTDMAAPLIYDQKLLPYIQAELAKEIGYCSMASADKKIQDLKGLITVYPYYMFGKDKGSYCYHLAYGSWRREVVKQQVHLSIFSIILKPLHNLLSKRWYIRRLF